MVDETGLELGPKRKLIIPMAWVAAGLVVSAGVTWKMATFYHQDKHQNERVVSSIDQVTNSVAKLTETIDAIVDKQAENEKKILKLEMEVNP